MWVAPALIASAPSFEEDSRGKKVGLTLSGGGARGLAHIGVLHVLDSLGVQIDYITGTSTGSIVGGMYASGYTAKEIEEFALKMDWETLFARRTDLTHMHPVWRDSEQRFVFEIPVEERKLRLTTGAIEGQQLWNTLNEVFLHVYDVNDFNLLDIPFACVATNVEDGEPVVIRDGDLVTAVRASMAIPSVFTVVERDGKKLIDGGVVNNFPVLTAKEMGAEFVIGVNVSQGLRPAEELVTPIDIIYQMGFYSDARSFVRNREATDLFIEPDLEGYTAASFFHTSDIIERGKAAARKAVPALIALPSRKLPVDEKERIPEREDIKLVIDSLALMGLYDVRPWFVRNTINISPGDTITAATLTSAINRLYATNYFDRVHYQLKRSEDTGYLILELDMAERPVANLSAAIHFNSFTGAGITGRLGTNRFFLYNAHASATVLLGEQPAIRSNAVYFTNDRRNIWLQWKNKARRLNFPLYENFETVSEYRQGIIRSELSFNWLTGQNSFASAGMAYFYQSLSPTMRSPIHLEGHNTALESNLQWKYHTLNSNSFPHRGQRIQLRGSFIFNQSPSFKEITMNGEETTPEEMGLYLQNFIQAQLLYENYITIRDRVTQISRVQFGYNFLREQGFVNSFNVGGTNLFLDKQVTFAGLNEYELLTESVIAGGIGYRYHIGRNLYATLFGNAALFDFKLDMPEEISRENFMFGGAASIGYDGLLGPVELSFSYSPETDRVIGYINVGWAF